MNQDRVLVRRASVSVVAGVLIAVAVAAPLAQTHEQRANSDGAVASGSARPAAEAAASNDRPARRARDRRRENRAADQETITSSSVAAQSPAVLEATAEPQQVCRSMKVIGSRIERKICATPEEWAANQESSAKDADEFMRQMREIASIAPSQGSGPQQSATPASLK